MKADSSQIVTSPLNESFFSVNKSEKVYRAHTYWTKQSINVIGKFVKHFSSEGDLVLDCFAGSGMTGLASIIAKRNSLLLDTSAASCHIARGYCTPVNVNAAKIVFKAIFDTLAEDRKTLYFTRCECGCEGEIAFTVVGEVYSCPDCGGKLNVGAELYENIIQQKKNRHFKNHDTLKCPKCNQIYNKSSLTFLNFEPVVIVYDCPKCGRRRKAVDIDDEAKWKAVTKLSELSYHSLPFIGSESKRNLTKGIKCTHQLYSGRNLASLSLLFREIKKIGNEKMKHFLLFVFTSILFNVSLLSTYRKYENTSIRMGTLYIPSAIKDNNVFLSFERKFKSILNTNYALFENGKKDIGKVKIIQMSATEIRENVKKRSVDYVFIDPPYSDIINYSDLNAVWEAWLPEKTYTSKEIIVDIRNGKSLQNYELKMKTVFENLSYVLKPQHWLTLIFHHPQPLHWAAIQNAIENTAFQPHFNDKPIVIRSKSRTASQLNTRKIVQGFLIMNFRKEPNNSLVLGNISKREFDKLLIETIGNARNLGINVKSDIYDYLIYKLFPKTHIKDFNFDRLYEIAQTQVF